ncbi:hypothetical protein [Martelella alba]|uniref:hypothetical protein n=1 Tax=Martelella alba TaxID=2590451 RepID=UPI0015E84C9C|nr:hypothetical protein [Martelella alba]
MTGRHGAERNADSSASPAAVLTRDAAASKAGDAAQVDVSVMRPANTKVNIKFLY